MQFPLVLRHTALYIKKTQKINPSVRSVARWKMLSILASNKRGSIMGEQVGLDLAHCPLPGAESSVTRCCWQHGWVALAGREPTAALQSPCCPGSTVRQVTRQPLSAASTSPSAHRQASACGPAAPVNLAAPWLSHPPQLSRVQLNKRIFVSQRALDSPPTISLVPLSCAEAGE